MNKLDVQSFSPIPTYNNACLCQLSYAQFNDIITNLWCVVKTNNLIIKSLKKNVKLGRGNHTEAKKDQLN